MSDIEVKVPDIGDFTDVPIIELFVEPGESIEAEDPIATLESDKATMDVPAPQSGKVKKVLVKLGDKVSEGTPLLMLEAEEQSESKPAEDKPAPAAPFAPPRLRLSCGVLTQLKVPAVKGRCLGREQQ